MGDVNGVGPEILAKALTHRALDAIADIIVYGSPDALARARTLCGIASPERDVRFSDSDVLVPTIMRGEVHADAGRAAVAWIRQAVADAIRGDVDAVVTCPISKECIHLAGSSALGHTEILAEMTHTPDYRMSLFSDRMRIVHVSAHVPLAEALELVRTPRIVETIRIADQALEDLRLPRRKIAVAGLNPHAGEGGLLGAEEALQIAPAVKACQQEGIDCSGPYPPDTVFRRMHLGEFDLVVAMYHDQGHIPLKLIAMDEGVQVTLGIPIVRTSVDHGTAYDIAWQGIAREDSLVAAITLAATMSNARRTGAVI